MNPALAALIATLKDAMQRDDEAAGIEAAMQILEFGLNDLHRIANALETLSKGQTP